ncbi:MAG: hypothetical protein HY926_15570 [Elusimicrobia bacterium]|nr:hypothetical protein [Elusimicrobiota bacterium]
MSLGLLLVLAFPGPSPAQAKQDKTGASFRLPACQRPGPDEFVFGLAGPAQDATDGFGRDNLRALAQGVPAGRLALFAAPATKDRFQDPLSAAEALESLADNPQKKIRLLFTGHGLPEGMWLGKDQEGEDRWIELPELADAVTRARRAGKTVKGQFVACYGGRFAEAFMPGPGLAPACGVFATVPEKKAEGCYESRGEQRLDYLFTAAQAEACGPQRDFRETHAKVFTRLAGYDIPMLSSDYFLLYGPAARRLGRAERAPYPRRGLVRRTLADGAAVYADLVNSRVVKALKSGGPLPMPEVSVVDCRGDDPDAALAADDLHLSSFFLHRGPAYAGWPPADCAPTLRLAWRQGAAVSSAAFDMAAFPEDEVWEPESRSTTTALFRKDLSVEELLLPLDDLKPETRLLLSRILPLFQESERGEALARRLEALAAPDTWNGRAMRGIIDGMRRFKGDGKSAPEGTRFWGSWLRTYLLDLAGDADTEEENLDYSRLAFLTAAAVSENVLREEARTDAEAAELVTQLEELRACERTLP